MFLNSQSKNNPLVMSIGITGHRFLRDEDKLEQAIDEVFNFLSDRYTQTHFCLYSPLAEGADRLAAKVFLRYKADLIVVLPLPVSEYQKDFSFEKSILEFSNLCDQAVNILHLPLESDHRVAYKNVGQFLLDHCDVMIALWDGKESKMIGSTASIVKLARDQKMPLAWIHAGNRIAGTQIAVSLGTTQGKIEYENFDE